VKSKYLEGVPVQVVFRHEGGEVIYFMFLEHPYPLPNHLITTSYQGLKDSQLAFKSMNHVIIKLHLMTCNIQSTK
jgi:hypothetical protein